MRRVTTLCATACIAVSALAVVSPAGVTRLPLGVVFGYVVGTFLLFLVWPIDWPIYTFGSDAHDPKRVGDCFAQAVALAKEAGYREFRRYTARRFDLVALP